MRRVLGPALLVVILALALPVAATENANYKDKFDSIGWAGSNGSLYWSGNWQEIGDGASNDEKQGNVRVVSSGNCASDKCMRFSAPLTTLLGPIGALRDADTSVLEEAELRFDLKATAALIGSQLLVEVSDGDGWSTVASYNLGAAQTDSPTIDVSDYRSEDFAVRFQLSAVLLGSDVFIDNVQITGEMVETTTTTTAPATTSTTEDGDEPSSSTTTTRPDSPTTSTTVRATTTTRPSITQDVAVDDTTTSTTVAATTTTTEANDGNNGILIGGGAGGGSDDTEPPGSDGSPEGSGIRQTARGLQADFDAGLYGDVSAISPITGVDYQARFSMAVEIIEASWAWIVLLALVIAWSIVSGMDRRKSQLIG
jgi:hypothetical protein